MVSGYSTRAICNLKEALFSSPTASDFKVRSKASAALGLTVVVAPKNYEMNSLPSSSRMV